MPTSHSRPAAAGHFGPYGSRDLPTDLRVLTNKVSGKRFKWLQVVIREKQLQFKKAALITITVVFFFQNVGSSFFSRLKKKAMIIIPTIKKKVTIN